MLFVRDQRFVIMRGKSHIAVFLVPAILIYTLFLIYPLVNSLRLSLYAVDTIAGAPQFVGLENFRRLFVDDIWSPQMANAFLNNFKFFIVHMIVQNPIGLLLAAMLTTRSLRGRNLYRTVFFLPTMLSVVIIGFIWQLILSPLWGVAEGILSAVGLGARFQPWLGLPEFALPMLSLISVWQFTGIPMILFYTALIGISDEIIQSAHVDGANGWAIFWRIKFPLILPVVGIVGVLTFVGNFNAFDLIYTTQGVLAGPNFATDILGTFFYRTFFGQQLQLGNPTMGAAIASLMFLTILAGVLLYMLWRRRIETYEF